jgi:glycosyltransferase involved in cell wall biosynthesis
VIATILSTNDIRGGAGRAAYRLHKGLNEIGLHSYMVVRRKSSSHKEIFEIDIKKKSCAQIKERLLGKFIQGQYINQNRTPLSNTIFTLPYPGYDLSNLEIIRESNIINMHWVSYFLSLTTIKKLLRMGKPVVWTLHDQWAFTGGCHYCAGCNHYVDSCANCSQIADDPLHLPQAIFKDKIKYFKDENLTIVTPSQWLYRCARNSRLFKNSRIELIPNSLETHHFFPVPKKEAKKKLGIPEHSMTLLFVAEMGYEKRKGLKELLDAVQICKKNKNFKQLMQKKMINILCFGEPGKNLDQVGIHVESLGYINSEEKIRDAYNAADLYILSSLEDNLPNTMLEAMACGTPVVSFPIGGMPDMIKNGKTGAVAADISPRKLSEAILRLLFNPQEREKTGKNCRKLIRQRFALQHQAENYLALFKDLCKKKSSKNPGKKNLGINSNVKMEVELDPSLGPNVKSIFVKILKKKISSTIIRDNMLYIRLLNRIAQHIIRFTPLCVIILLYRRFPKKIKEKLTNLSKKHQKQKTKK